MIEIEKAILAVGIKYPDIVLPVLFELLEVSDFGAINDQVYRYLLRLYEEKEKITLLDTVNYFMGKIEAGYISDIDKFSYGVPKSGAEIFVLENIEKIKRHKAKKEGLRACIEEFEAPVPDFDRIVEIAESGKVRHTKREKPDFDTAMAEYLAWKNQQRTNIHTGYSEFDRLTDDFNPGEVVGIAARTTVGKSWMAMNVLHNMMGKVNEKIGFFTLEMSKAAFIERMMQLYYDLSRYEVEEKVLSGALVISEFEKKYKNLNIYSHVYSTSEISNLIRRDKLEIVFIDFLQLMRKVRGKSIYEAVTYQIAEIKEFAKNQEVMVFVMTQLSRQAEGGWIPVTIDAARDSGAIEENCDFIFGLWNPFLLEGADEKYKGKISIKLIKNKRGAVYGNGFSMSADTGRIRAIEYQLQDPEPQEGAE